MLPVWTSRSVERSSWASLLSFLVWVKQQQQFCCVKDKSLLSIAGNWDEKRLHYLARWLLVTLKYTLPSVLKRRSTTGRVSLVEAVPKIQNIPTGNEHSSGQRQTNTLYRLCRASVLQTFFTKLPCNAILCSQKIWSMGFKFCFSFLYYLFKSNRPYDISKHTPQNGYTISSPSSVQQDIFMYVTMKTCSYFSDWARSVSSLLLLAQHNSFENTSCLLPRPRTVWLFDWND